MGIHYRLRIHRMPVKKKKKKNFYVAAKPVADPGTLETVVTWFRLPPLETWNPVMLTPFNAYRNPLPVLKAKSSVGKVVLAAIELNKFSVPKFEIVNPDMVPPCALLV